MTYRKKISNKLSRCLSIPVLLSFGLVACNSGSSTNESGADSGLLTGKIAGVTVEGLSYQTESQSGVTTADSTFTFKEGESVSFFIGDIAIGQASAAAELTLFDLVGIADPDSLADGAETKLKQTTRNSFQFEHLSNLVVLLTALDEDGDFANGVVIPASLESVAQGKTLDILGSKTNTFKYDLTDSELLSEAVSEGVWQTTPTIASAGAALDAFYAAMGITPEVYAVSKELYDTDEDGNTDVTTSYAFDDVGNLVSTTKEAVDDQSLSIVTTYTYDDSGNRTGLYIDNDNDGTVDYQQEWGFNAQGRKVLDQTDSDGNGIFESRSFDEIAYHEAGIVSEYTSADEQYSDSTGELVSYYSSTERYDTNGNTVYTESTTKYTYATYSQNTTYTFDAAGNKTKVEVDTNGDGSPDSIDTFEYDDQQRVILEESDSDGDGEVDTTRTDAFDDSNNTSTASIDENADGIIDTFVTILNDDHDNTISIHIDEGNDGAIDEVITTDFSYDAEGRILTKHEISSDSNVLYTASYDEAGLLLSESQVYEDTPERNTLTTINYDEDGKITSSSYEAGVINTDSYSHHSTVIHDAYGGQTSTTTSSNSTSINSILYDERGNFIEDSSSETYFGEIVSDYAKKWTYDSDDQVITKTIIRDSETYSTTEYAYNEQGELIATTSTILSDDDGREGEVSVATYEFTDLASWQALYFRVDREESNNSSE